MSATQPQPAAFRWQLLPKWAAALALVAALGFGVAGALRLQLVEDITALLPEKDGESATLLRLAREWGLMRRVAIAVGPGEPGSDRLLAAGDAVAEAVAAVDGVERVTWQVDPEAGRRAAELLMDRAFLLGGAGVGGLDRAEVARRLASLKERLASPESLVIGRYLLADPLGLAREALFALEGAGRAMGARIERGRLVSAAGDHALVFIEVGFDPLDVGRAKAFVAELDRAVAAGLARAGAADLQVVTLGGAHFAAASGAAIIDDVRRAFLFTTVLVIAVFLAFFRRLRFLPAALVPGAAGIAVAVGVFGLLGIPVHALTLGFAATITGVSVDYAIHLLHRALHAGGEDSGQRMAAALSATGRPLALACGTTVAAFVLVATSAVPGLRQLAIFAAISIPAALAATLLVLPAFHAAILGGAPGRAGRAARWSRGLAALAGPATGAPRRGRRAVTGVVFLLAAAAGVWLGLAAPRSGDPRDLGYRDPDLAAREAKLAAVFPGLSDQVALVATGATIDEALAVNDATWRELGRVGIGRERVVSVAPFLPARAEQRAALAAAGRLLAEDGGVAAAFGDTGFAPGYLDDLRKRLEVPPLVPDDFAGTALEAVTAEAIRGAAGRFHVLTRVQAGGEADLDALARVAGAVPGLELVSERLETRRALEAMLADLGRMLGVWLAVALVVLGALHRSPRFGLVAALPALFGVAVALGLFGLLGRSLTPVAGAGLTLVLGLGIDYGLFVLCAGGRWAGEVAPAVAASALTTLAAFGVLAASDTRAMADLGLVILAGVSAAMLAALVLLPALGGGRRAGEGGAG
jgi:predicted exporter